MLLSSDSAATVPAKTNKVIQREINNTFKPTLRNLTPNIKQWKTPKSRQASSLSDINDGRGKRRRMQVEGVTCYTPGFFSVKMCLYLYFCGSFKRSICKCLICKLYCSSNLVHFILVTSILNPEIGSTIAV